MLLNEFNNKNVIKNTKFGFNNTTLLMHACKCLDMKEVNVLLSYFNDNKKEKLQYIQEKDKVLLFICLI